MKSGKEEFSADKGKSPLSLRLAGKKAVGMPALLHWSEDEAKKEIFDSDSGQAFFSDEEFFDYSVLPEANFAKPVKIVSDRLSSPSSGRGSESVQVYSDIPPGMNWWSFALSLLFSSQKAGLLQYGGIQILILWLFMTSLIGSSGLPGNVFFIVMSMTFFFGLILYFVFVKQKFGSVYRILEKGEKTEGVIFECGRKTFDWEEKMTHAYSGIRDGGSATYTVLGWKFCDSAGRLYESRAYYPEDERFRLKPGTKGFVYYDPYNPQDNVWLGPDWRYFAVHLGRL